MVNKQHKLSIRTQCQLLDLNRSTFYMPERRCVTDTEIANRIREIYEATPQYGYRRICAQLNREGEKVNRKKVYRLMKEMGLKALYPKPRTTIRGPGNKAYPYLLGGGLKIERPHQVWQVDITYLRLPGGFVYLTAIIDVYSRVVVSWRLSNSLSTESVIETLEVAVWLYGGPEIINTDQGGQFTSEAWEKVCTSHDIKMSMSHKGGSTNYALLSSYLHKIYDGLP